MLSPPKTLEEARKYGYGDWAGNPQGHRYREGYCAYEIYPTDRWMPYQCNRKNGHGINGLYCRQHAKMVGRMIKHET